jgi:hypothetical protein
LDKSIVLWETTGVIVIFIMGTLLHFVFDWSGRQRPVGLVAPVNESIWEHLKLVLWPALLYGIIEYLNLEGIVKDYWTAKTLGIYAAIISIVVLFYLYTAFTHRSILIIDILIFLASVITGQVVSCKIMASDDLPTFLPRVSVPFLSILIFLFFLFTYYPPHLPIFQNPIDGKYGI